MDDEPIFGPLNLKQFIRVAFSLGIGYFSYTYLPLKISIPIIVVVVMIFLSAFISHQSVVIDEEYIKRKRYSYKNLEEFQRWLKKNIAMLQSQISIREHQGLRQDPGLDKKLVMFESALRDIK